MTKKKIKLNHYKGILPYLGAGVLTLLLVFVGSLNKYDSSTSLSLDTFAKNDSSISVDQISELYMVAGLSNALNLASASDVTSNYVMANSMYDSGQTSSGKITKPDIVDIQSSRGIIEHIVSDGETMDTIAAQYGVSTDQIRWSNNLKTTDISSGMTLFIPSTSGIVYMVKSEDTIESIASKYGSTVPEIIAMNDLEVSGISEGMRIIIKDGVLPNTERPEYVAPVTTRIYSTYTYMGNSSNRVNLTCNRSLGAGQCTTWGWIKRPDLGFIKANANRWDDVARSAGILVDHIPEVGAIFQTDSGWYGHVGYVESVNSDGSINVSERNYAGCYGVLFSTIPASDVSNFNYIH